MQRMIKLKKMDFCYWVNELPKLKVGSCSERIVEIKKVNEAIKNTLQIALELSLHRHISSYALLGFTYTPTMNGQSLIIIINYTNKRGENYLSQIRVGESRKYIYSGIDDFLMQAILDEIINFSKENNLPAGELNFKVAANCEVSSSPLIFKVITKILLSILIAIDEEKMLNDSLMENFFMDEILNEVTKFQLVQREKIGEMIKE